MSEQYGQKKGAEEQIVMTTDNINSSSKNLSRCPKCGKSTDLSLESCQACGLVFAKYYNIRGGAIKTGGEKGHAYGRFRLLVDILMGISGTALILTGGVLIFVISSGGGKIVAKGSTFSSLGLGITAFVAGLAALGISVLGIIRCINR